ncbi:transporter [Pleurocapsa sp. CCALA 161]|uniref:ACT domain-containing protein n=1 Tax=Pleurocapsa sp. CCALA 161 TaxID=2107688 RepID=UPI000D083587|nr:ACT domain-containing protein [Pleurocapsa sp. CCALA 161]PSB12180.1 transporter [Pleurocapsa sp. CCALA 161]
MSGETSLSKLLQCMQPILSPGEYVFSCLGDQDNRYSQLNPLGQFRESEGITLILEREQADAANLSYSSIFSMITLSIHSSLEAVGFLAAITSKLAEHDISVNPISAYYHDHLFIPVARTSEAIMLLQEFSR